MKKFFLSLILTSYCLNCEAVWNGREASRDEYQNVYRLSFSYKARTGFFSFLSRTITGPVCTATAIGRFTILTAAHCVQVVRNYQNVSVNLDGESFPLEKVAIPDAYFPLADKYNEIDKRRNNVLNEIREYRQIPVNLQKKLNSLVAEIIPIHMKLANYDMAIITTKKALSNKIVLTKLKLSPITVGERVEVVGFGSISKDLNGFYFNTPTKPHYREEVLTDIIGGYLEVSAKSDADFITTPGDSGGPLLLSNSQEQIGVLRGAASNAKNINASQFLYLYEQKNFILSHLK